MEVDVGDIPFDIDFHPSAPLVATGLISGKLLLYRYVEDSTPERVFVVRAHKRESCRAVRFLNSGKVILTASTDRSILATDSESGKAVLRMKEAHEAEINRLVKLTDTTVASGDDKGFIKVWDTRQKVCCNSFRPHDEYISDMTYVEDHMQILATSGDGKLSVNSLRKNKAQWISEFSEDELLSLVVMKDCSKVVCGTQTGALLLYSWGHFEDCSDRFLGHPESVETVLKLDEDTLISGSCDGVIRLAGILPNRIIQPLAEHGDEPIERLAFSNDKKLLGSISHDAVLKLWNLQELVDGQHATEKKEAFDTDSDHSDDMDIDDAPSSSSRAGLKGKKQKQGKGKWSDIDSFVADL